MDQLTLYTVQNLSTLLFESIPCTIGTAPPYCNTKLEANSVYIVREDNGTPKIQVNVYDLSTGVKCFSISRSSSLSTQWYMYSEPEHVEVARISIGGFTRRADLFNNTSALMKYGPGILGKFHRHFYDDSGNLFSWNRRSMYLEKISNPGGGEEEMRRRIGVVNHLRAYRFDWEVQIDSTNINPITALATAFVTMKTQWPLYGRTHAPSYPGRPQNLAEAKQLAKPKPTTTNAKELFENNDPARLQVYIPEEPTREPLNLFDPPEFLEYKYRYNL